MLLLLDHLNKFMFGDDVRDRKSTIFSDILVRLVGLHLGPHSPVAVELVQLAYCSMVVKLKSRLHVVLVMLWQLCVGINILQLWESYKCYRMHGYASMYLPG